ncbi:MAG: prolipoprotein diacylglyceryl transferase, partial [Acidimicrobiia bacterium]
RAKKRGFDEDQVWTAASWAVVGAILGARIAYVVGHLSEFSSPAEWIRIWEGGISLVGGMMGGWLASYLYSKRAGINFFDLADLAAPGLALGVALGRSGDLAIGDHLGKETSGFWAWQYQGGELISPPPCLFPDGRLVYSTVDGCIEPGVFVHQTALYDAIWSLAILGILLILDRTPRNRGFLALAWASLYALGRIATDFLRVDKTWLGLGLTGSQITSILVLAFCVYLIVRYGGVPHTEPSKKPTITSEEAPASLTTMPSDEASESGPAEG